MVAWGALLPGTASACPSIAPLWARGFGGSDDDEARAVAVDVDDNIVLVGRFEGSDFDLGGGPLAGHGGQDGFVAKFDSGGSHLWSLAIGGVDDDKAISLAVDHVGISGAIRS